MSEKSEKKISENSNFFLHPFEFGKYVISEISGRLLIGQNDSLGVQPLVDICIEYKKGQNDLTDTFEANLTIGYKI